MQVSGTLEAEVEQTCVVTLEPLVNHVAESFSVDYWPETDMPEPSGGELDMHDEPDLEPIVAGRIEVGRVVFECLAGAIDLFPRKPGVTFEPPAAATEVRSDSREPLRGPGQDQEQAVRPARAMACKAVEKLVVSRPAPAMVGRFPGALRGWRLGVRSRPGPQLSHAGRRRHGRAAHDIARCHGRRSRPGRGRSGRRPGA